MTMGAKGRGSRPSLRWARYSFAVNAIANSPPAAVMQECTLSVEFNLGVSSVGHPPGELPGNIKTA
jgi:hypothetical protein